MSTGGPWCTKRSKESFSSSGDAPHREEAPLRDEDKGREVSKVAGHKGSGSPGGEAPMEVAGRDSRGAAGSPPASNLQSSLHLRLSVLSNHLAPASSPGGPEAASVLARNLTRGVPTCGPAPVPDTCSSGTLHARLSFSRPAWQQPPRLTASPQRYSLGLHTSQSSHVDSSLLSPGECGRPSKGAAQECGGASSKGRKETDSCCVKCSGTGKAPSGCACSCALGYTGGGTPLPPPLPHGRDSRSLFAKQATNSTTNSTAAWSAESKSCCSKCGSTNPAACGCNCGPADAITGGTAGAPWVAHVGTRSSAVLFGRVAAREPEHHRGSFLTPEALTGCTPPAAGGIAAGGVPGARPDIRRDHRVLFARAAREPECHHRSFLEGASLVGVGDTRGVPRGDSRLLFGRPCSEATGVTNTTAEDRAATAGAALLQQAKEGVALYSDASVAAYSDKNNGTTGGRASTAVRGTGAPAAPGTAWQGARRDSRALFACVPPPHSPAEAPAVPLPAGEARSSAAPPQAPSQARLSSLISSWSSSAPAGSAPNTGVPEGAHGRGEGAHGRGEGAPDSEHHVTMVVPLPSGTTARGLQVEVVAGRLLRVVVAGPGCTRVLFEGPLPRGVASARSSQALLRDSALYLSFPKA